MATSRSRPRGRENSRPPTGGAVSEHTGKIYGVAVASVAVIVAFLALTSVGHDISAATQHFMLFYAGVFTLITLCLSVGLGLIATDRMILHPGHRVLAQSAHRAASFGSVSFLIIHVVTEILAQRVHLLDSVVPFLSPFRTFYIGLGTIASDLILLIAITGIMRKRFTAHGNAWRWRAIHYSAYAAFVFGVWHGLLGGRPGKPYVDWSYGFVVALVALGLAVRILANSLRPKQTLSAPPVPESAGSGSAPMRAASMFTQLASVRNATSAALVAQSGPQPMLAGPVGWDPAQDAGMAPAIAALPAADAPYGYEDDRQPYYEPGYEGPPRFLGTPRESGPMPRVTAGQAQHAGYGQAQGWDPQAQGWDPQAQGWDPQAQGWDPQAQGWDTQAQGWGTGPVARPVSGPMPMVTNGPMPRGTGPIPEDGYGPGQSRGGPMPPARRGRAPRAGTGPRPIGAGQAGPGGPGGGGMPGGGAGSPASGPRPQLPRSAAGRAPRGATGPNPTEPNGPMPRPGTGPVPPRGRAGRPGGGQPGGQPGGRQQGRPQPGRGRPGGRSAHGHPGPAGPGWAGAGDWAGSQGPMTAPRSAGPAGWPGSPGTAGSADWAGQEWAESQEWAGSADWADGAEGEGWTSGQPPWEGGTAPDPGFRYGEPGPGMPGYQAPRGWYRGGEDRR